MINPFASYDYDECSRAFKIESDVAYNDWIHNVLMKDASRIFTDLHLIILTMQ